MTDTQDDGDAAAAVAPGFAGFVDKIKEQLTPGQRQSAGLLVALTVAVLFFGAPTTGSSVGSGFVASPTITPVGNPVPTTAPPAAAIPPAPVVAAPRPTPTTTRPPRNSPSGGPAPTTPPTTAPSPPPPPPPEPIAPATFVALVTSDASAGGRDDAGIAQVFLADAGIQATTVTYDPQNASLCNDIASAGNVVLASSGVDADLRDCLLSGGVTTIAFDSYGDSPPGSPGAGQVLSTAPGIAASVVDVGTWALADGALDGQVVGIVGPTSHQSEVAGAADALRGLGIDVAAEAYVDVSGPPGSDVTTGSLDFFGQGVTTVVFAVPVAFQNEWATRASLLQGNIQYLVSDAFDSVNNEGYLPVLGQARAHTTLLGPWFTRLSGETATQTTCRGIWEASAASGGTTDGGSELFQVYSWCLNATLASAPSATAYAEYTTQLRAAPTPSPLTSELAGLPGGGYGPAQSAALTLDTDCSCWTPDDDPAFAPR